MHVCNLWKAANVLLFKQCTLTTWYCPHSPTAAAAVIDQYLPPTVATVANLEQRVCCRGPMLGQTDLTVSWTLYTMQAPGSVNNGAIFNLKVRL